MIGRNWLQEIKLNWSDIKIVHSFSSLDNVLRKHEDVFRPQLGNLEDVTAKIHVVPQAHPRFFRARSVPHSLKDKVAQELQRLQDLQVITSVKYSKWAAPVVPIVKEDGFLQLCGDYKVTVNPSLVPDTYPLPRVDDLFAAL